MEEKKVEKIFWYQSVNLLFVVPNLDIDYTPKQKIAGFDLDGTLIKSCIAEEVVEKIEYNIPKDKLILRFRKLVQEKYLIVIFSNQKGLKKGKIEMVDFMRNYEEVNRSFYDNKIPVFALFALDNDVLRKPHTGMWRYFRAYFKKTFDGAIGLSGESFFVGDAAGRGKVTGKGINKKADFSYTDRAFAENIGIKFYTPEMYFDNMSFQNERKMIYPPSVFTDDEKNNILRSWRKFSNKDPKFSVVYQNFFRYFKSAFPNEKQFFAIFVGPPACGKSSLAKKICKDFYETTSYAKIPRTELPFFEPKILTRDDPLYKTKRKLSEAVKLFLADGHSVIIDTTAPSRETRAEYVELMREFEVNIPLIVFNSIITCEMANHLNKMRVELSRGDINEIPLVAYKIFNKNYLKPVTEEFEKLGLTKFDIINFCPDERKIPDEFMMIFGE